MMHTRRLIALERCLSPPADEFCHCLLYYFADEPPPDRVLCDRCGRMRRGEHKLVRYVEVIVTAQEEVHTPNPPAT
jgi:hypothetical protein